MQDWPNVLLQAKVSLQNILVPDNESPASNPSKDPTQHLLTSIVRHSTQNKGQKWLSNFEVAAMHLSVHRKASI
jgi:hypothetical protein